MSCRFLRAVAVAVTIPGVYFMRQPPSSPLDDRHDQHHDYKYVNEKYKELAQEEKRAKDRNKTEENRDEGRWEQHSVHLLDLSMNYSLSWFI
jgi:hypothetical protein